MDIKEIIKAKKEMERDIYHAAFRAKHEFYEKTGICPNSISIVLVGIQELGESSPFYEIDRVNSTLSLD